LESLEDRNLMSVGLEFHVNTKTLLDQSHPDVASQQALSGRSVVVWQDQFDASNTDSDIKAQIFDGAGHKIGGEITVAATSSRETEPAVAMDARGNFVVVWTQAISDGNTDIRGQRFDANGTPIGGVLNLTTDTRPESDPDVAMDRAGNFVVSYTLDFTSTDQDVRARRFASDGTLLGTDIVIGGSGANEHSSSVARSPDGHFNVVWQLDVPVTGGGINSDIRLKHYNAAGTQLGTHTIANSRRSEIDPEVAMDRHGHAVVVYELVSSTLNDDIMARKFFANGVLGPTIRVDVSRDYEFNPTVTMDHNDGDFVVAYQRLHNNGTSLVPPNNLIVREMNADGSIKNTFNLGDVGFTPQLSINDSDVYFLAYASFARTDDPGVGIFGRRGHLV